MYSENRGLRGISADCTLASDAITGRRNDISDIAGWLDVATKAKLMFSDQPDRYWMAFISSDIDPDEWKRLSKFNIDWQADPYSNALSTSSQCVTATGGSDSDVFSIPDDIVAYPEVTIRALNGGSTALTGFTFTLNGDAITVTQTFPALTSVNISSISQTVTYGTTLDEELVGAFDPAALAMSTVVGDFGLLVPGNNAWGLTWTGAATTVSVCFRWRRRYR
jgi:phage-related protein